MRKDFEEHEHAHENFKEEKHHHRRHSRGGKAFLILGLIVICCIGCYVYISGIYNNMVNQEEAVEAAWSDVQTQYQRRLDLTPGFTLAAKILTLQDPDTFESVTDARRDAAAEVNAGASLLEDEAAFNDYIQSQKKLGTALDNLVDLAGSCAIVSESQTLEKLQSQLKEADKKITAAEEAYNDAAQLFNTNIRTFPAVLFAEKSGFEKKPYIK